MGCTSAKSVVRPVHAPCRKLSVTGAFQPDWTTVVLNTDTGDITQGTVGGEVLAKFVFEREPAEPATNAAKKHHWVQQKIGGTWDETKLGGQVKFKCLDQAQVEALWNDMGAMPLFKSEVTTDSPKRNPSGFTSNTSGDSPNKSEISWGPDSPKSPVKATKKYHVGGLAEWNGKVYIMTGSIDDMVNVVEKDSREVVFTLRQGFGRYSGVEDSPEVSFLKFYDGSVQKKRLSQRKAESQMTAEDKAIMQQSFCGVRIKDDDGGPTNELFLSLRPSNLENVPISLFAMAVLYSSVVLNNVK